MKASTVQSSKTYPRRGFRQHAAPQQKRQKEESYHFSAENPGDARDRENITDWKNKRRKL